MANRARGWWRRVGQWLVYLVVRIVVCVAQVMTADSCRWWAKVLAGLVYDRLRIRRRVIDDNLRHAFPRWTADERRYWARRMWEHLFLMFFEIAHAAQRLHVANWKRFVEVDGIGSFVEFLLSPGAKLLVSGHFGNFELGGYVAGLLGFPTYSIARPLDNPWLDRFVKRFRMRTGQYILDKQGSIMAVERIASVGGIIGVLADQHAGPKGCWVEFFGRPASSHKAIALLCLSHQAKLAVVTMQRTGSFLRYRVRLLEVIDPQHLANGQRDVRWITQRYHDVLERVIRETPEQYWWVHRRWREPPVRVAKRGAAAA